MEREQESLLERALTDYIKGSKSKLCYIGNRQLRKFMEQNPGDYPNLSDSQKLGAAIASFMAFRARIYDVEKIKSGASAVEGLRPIWVDAKMNVIGVV